MSGVKITGFDEMQRKLSDISDRARSLSGSHRLSSSELFSADFLGRCSRFSSFEELVAASGFEVEIQQNLDANPEKEWDEFIGKNTSYPDWKIMCKAAVSEWTGRQLGL